MTWSAVASATVEDARSAVLEALAGPVSEEVAVDGASGLVSAESLTALSPWPPFDSARIDGVAVRAASFPVAFVTACDMPFVA
ncbi:MAG: hypothetical protein MUF10_15110, partial [Thermoanaerobaculaceae bacterium]|nr:hypothetical protein [Thermoanaerobaculaceae bacterium]